MREFTRICAVVLLAFLLPLSEADAGKADDIVQLSPDTYLISRTSYGGVFTSMGKLKSKVIKDANEFAKSEGKVLVPISTSERPVGGPGQWPQFDYQFRLVDPNSPDAKSTALVPLPDVVIQDNRGGNREPPPVSNTPEKKDLYGELIKLDDLRKKGILSDEEFEAQKQKLLSEN